jgi:ABC-type branched-subunit amino acid transport system substrate-binding protein
VTARARRVAAGLVLGLLGLAVAPAWTAPLTPQERRGKALYLRGASAQDPDVKAYLRGADLEVPAAVMPCANCHGRDGKGRTEGGVAAPDITWSQLTRPAAHRHADGRTHAPHSRLTLGSTVTRGVDPGGHGLDSSMPLYRFSPEALEALVAYLRRLGSERDPGLGPQRLLIGSVAPAGSPAAREAQALWRAYFDDVNAAGGIHGRRLELRLAEAAPGSGAAGVEAALRTLLGDEGVFALLGVVLPDAGDGVAALLAEHEAPLIGPFTLVPRQRQPPERETFHVAPGLVEQAHALLKSLDALPGGKSARLALLWPDEPGPTAAAEQLARELGRTGRAPVLTRGLARAALAAPETLQALRAAQADTLLLPSLRGEEGALLKAADDLGIHPQVLLPGYAGGAAVLDLPAAFDGRVRIGLALPPWDPARARDESVRRVLLAGGRRPGPGVLVAFRGARLLVEALRRAGRDVSRDALVTTLEGFYDFDLGVGPRVTFGPNRRLGVAGAHVLAPDLRRRAFVPVAEWTPAE